jgi:hypothetical protein
VRPPDGDVAQAPAIAQRDGAAGVDSVVADAVVARRWVTVAVRLGLDARGVGLGRRPARKRPVWSLLVVVGDEAVDLRLRPRKRVRRALRRQVLLERLVKALHLAAGLRVIGAQDASTSRTSCERVATRIPASPRKWTEHDCGTS